MSEKTNIELAAFSDEELEEAFFERFSDRTIQGMCDDRDVIDYDSGDFAEIDFFTDDAIEAAYESRQLGLTISSDSVKWLETYLRANDLVNATFLLRDLLPVLNNYNVTLTKE